MATLKPKGIVLHCSASTWGDANVIDDWHKSRGWSGIGYHYVVLNGHRSYGSNYRKEIDGKIEPGRDFNVRGAHCVARGLNSHTIGVCLIGTPFAIVQNAVQANSRMVIRPYATDRQINAVLHIIKTVCDRHNINPKGSFMVKGYKVPCVSQHSDHDPGKPFCASLKVKNILTLL